jgi:hypothetical protein
MAQEQSQSATSTENQDQRGVVRQRRQLDDFHLDPNVIDQLTGRDKARFRRLTPIKGVTDETLDPIVVNALAQLEAKYRPRLESTRKKLAEKYLDAAEDVTARHNRQALPRTTRILLATDGVYEALLLKALEDGVGQQAEPAEAPDSTHAGKSQSPNAGV